MTEGKNLINGLKICGNFLKKKIRENEDGIKRTGSILAIVLATNLSSFTTTYMQKNLGNISNENASVINSLNSVPILYDIGFSVGHRLFYNDKDYLGTAENTIGQKNLFSRKYLKLIQKGIDKD